MLWIDLNITWILYNINAAKFPFTLYPISADKCNNLWTIKSLLTENRVNFSEVRS